MPTPTSGNFKETYLHFFINNGQRYCGLPGIYHTKISNEIFAAIKDRVEQSDIPAAEIGEEDTRRYGVQLVDGTILVEKLDAIINEKMTSLVNKETYKTTDMIAFIDLNLSSANTKLDALQRSVDSLTAKLEGLTQKIVGN